jgi:hypothetical protein
VTKRIAPVGLIMALACGDGVGPTTPPSDISTMAVGEVRVLNPADIQNGIDLPAGFSARDYVIIVGNTSSSHDVVANYVVKADMSTDASFGISSPSDVSPQSSIMIGQIPVARTPQQAVENRVRAFERTGLARLKPSNPLAGMSARRSTQPAAMVIPAVGDVINLKIPDASTTDICANFFSTQAVVASVSAKAILVVDTLDGPPATLFTQAQMDSITNEFDNVTYPTDVAYFNTPTDFDGNGRIIMLFTGQVNKLTPPGTDSFVSGFFFAGDFFPTVDTPEAQGCAASNGAEIFYLLSPDLTGRFGNVHTASSVRQGVRGTIAHEFQHMINAGGRFVSPTATFPEALWLDEGLAHFAEDAVGRVQRGFGDLQTLAFNDLVPCNAPCSQANDFDAFFLQNLVRLAFWMQKPDQFSPMSKMADTSLAVRGAAWAILRYAADNYSASDPRVFTRKLVAGPDTGVKNFNAATKAPIDTVVSGWLVSMYADHLGISELNPKYEYRSYNFRSAMPPIARAYLKQSVATYPLTVQSIGSGSDNFSATNRSGTGTYYSLNVAAGAGAKNVKILDVAGNVANFAGEHVYVLRVQ